MVKVSVFDIRLCYFDSFNRMVRSDDFMVKVGDSVIGFTLHVIPDVRVEVVP